MSDLVWDWDELFGTDDSIAPRAEAVKIPVSRVKNTHDTVEFGEYGERLRGIRSMQIVKHPLDPVWYQVDYVIESLSNIGGTLEVLDVRKMVDEFGMSSWTTAPVEPWEFNAAESELKKMFVQMGSGGRW